MIGGTTTVGTPCDDGNPPSAGDAYAATCECIGAFANDCAGVAGGTAQPGTACDEEVVLAGMARLLDESASLHVRDPRGFGPLHLAALHGLLRVTQQLLHDGAEPESRDALNRTPREIAVMRGFVDVAAEFVPQTGNVSMARFLKNRES